MAQAPPQPAGGPGSGLHQALDLRWRVRGDEPDSLNESLAYAVERSDGLAVRGTAELVAEITTDFDVICCATGTGGTLAGVAAGLTGPRRALGFAVLKGARFLEDEVRRLQQDAYGQVTTTWAVDLDFHFGGYAKRSTALDAFIVDFDDRHGVTLDWVYEAKMLYGIAPGTRVVAVLG